MATIAMAGQEMDQMLRSRMAGLAASPNTRARSVAERNRELFEQQRPRRRGPTPEMFFTKYIDNSRIVKADDPERRREMRSFTIVMTIFFALTMVYVWQHFSAVELGYKVEAQKQQVEQMREANRQLRLTEAQLSDPGRIDRIAKQLGLDVPMPGQVVRPDGASADGPVLAQMQTPVAVPVLSAN
jgi:cell division protein FtsL